MKHSLIILFSLLFLGCDSYLTSDSNDYNPGQTANQQVDRLIKQSEANFDLKLLKDSLVGNHIDKYLRKAIVLCNLENLLNKKVEIYLLIGKRYRNISNYGYAITNYKKALEIAKKSNDDRLKAYSTHEMAVAFRRIDDNAQALMLHFQALEWAESAKDTFLIHSSLNGVGNIYYSYNDIQQAINYFHQSLNYLGTPRNLLGEAINTHNIGEGWLFLENPDSALFYINKSYAINLKIESLIGQAICKNGMGNIYVQLKKYSKALNYFKESLAINRKIGDLIYVAYNLRNLGEAYLNLNQFKKAEKCLTEALAISKEIGSNSESMETLKSLSLLYKETGKLDNSIKFLQESMVYKDSITKEVSEQNSKAMHVLYKSEKQEREILILKQENQLNNLKLSRQKYISAGVIFLLFIGLLFIFVILRQRKLKSQYSEIQLEQKLLQVQLNPHFIFNSLSAVQNYIMQNDKLAAFDYLANFARLIRNTLMDSKTEYTSLEREIGMLNDYIKLQQLRFHNVFTYDIFVDESIDPANCYLPPMLAQPMIENSIEHGLKPLNENGILLIRFKKVHSYLFIEIEDNGIGLTAASQNRNAKEHVSLATEITNKRLKNLQHVSKQDCKIDTIDKNKTKGLTGVIVKIAIPYRELD